MVLAPDAVTGPVNPVYDPSDCQDSSSFDQSMISGNILICTYSFNFIYGGSTIKRVEETASNLSAAGFVMVVQSDTAGSRFDPIPISIPGIIITSQTDSQVGYSAVCTYVFTYEKYICGFVQKLWYAMADW